MNLDYARDPETASFEKDHWWVRSRFGLIDRLLKRLESARPWAIMEIGCGTGINMDYLETQYGSGLAQLVGVDPDATLASTGQRAVRRDIPSGQSFDLILALDVLEHVEHPMDLLKDLRAHLKPSGLLLVSVPSFQWL